MLYTFKENQSDSDRLMNLHGEYQAEPAIEREFGLVRIGQDITGLV